MTFQFPGLDCFQGDVLHTHEWKGPEQFKGKKVIVVGFGDSAIDAATEISHLNDKVFPNPNEHLIMVYY